MIGHVLSSYDFSFKGMMENVHEKWKENKWLPYLTWYDYGDMSHHEQEKSSPHLGR